MSAEPIPALRAVEMIPSENEGQPIVVFRDPEGVCDDLVVLPMAAFFIASCFNGVNDIGAIQAAFQQQFGQRVAEEDVRELARQLDENRLLESPRYYDERLRLEKEFEAMSARPFVHAGEAYPSNPETLRAAFEAYFTLDGGAGPIDSQRVGSDSRKMAGIIVPHIDPRAGGSCASFALKALAESPRPDVFVIFGTSHQPLPNPVSVLDKDFETPLGLVPRDAEFIGRLKELYGEDRMNGGGLSHKVEHSIEFMVVFLHALFGEPAPFTIVPALCGSFHECIDSGRSPSMVAPLDDFYKAVRQAGEESGKTVCYVAGADLAHMGRKFGDDMDLTDDLIYKTRASDLEMLRHVEARDREAFFRNLHAEQDSRKVCGLPPIYAMLSCMNASKGRLLRYDYSIEPSTESMVTFCSMAFYE